jgi:hypothetical protein
MIERPIFLLGMPRSGTTWLSQVFESHPQVVVRLSPNFSHSLKDRLHIQSSRSDWEAVLFEASESVDPFLTQDWRRQRGDLPVHPAKNGAVRLVVKDTRYLSTYRSGMDRLPDARCLYVVRHPCAVLNSWMNSAEFPEGANIEEQWRSGACRKGEEKGEFWGFEDWRLETLSFLEQQKANPERYRVFSYEQAVRNPQAVFEDLFSFVGLQLHPSTMEFVERSHQSHDGDSYSVFKDPALVLDQWRNTFPSTLAGAISEELSGTDLEGYLD